jgi:anthranilate phosphoribosyltransferase
VAAAAGAPVAKHGNRHASSCSGSADVLEALGVNIRLTPEQVGRCIDEIGIGFCFAPLLHQAMKHVIPVRQALGIRTIFNLLGPLSNPAGAAYQLIGSSRIATARILAGAVAALGTTRTLVVCGNDQLDEVSLWGTTTVFDVQGESISSMEWTAAEMGLPACHVEDLRIESPQQSATMIQQALSGEPGPARDMAAANAGAALLATGRASTIREGVEQALGAIETGAARRKLEELIAWTTKNA